MDALSKQLRQASVFGEDTDAIYLRFEYPVRLYSIFTAIFTALNVVFGHFIFAYGVKGERLSSVGWKDIPHVYFTDYGNILAAYRWIEEDNLI